MLLVYWLKQSINYKGNLNYGIALSKKKIFFLLLSESLLFLLLFLFYYLNQNPDTANSFAWQNIFLYFRGVLPIMALTTIDDRTFRFLSNPTWECLIAALIIDYLVLLAVARIRSKSTSKGARLKPLILTKKAVSQNMQTSSSLESLHINCK